jgi:hypothetical protein
MFLRQVSKGSTFRVEAVLGFARDLGWIDLLDAVHINLVLVAVLHSEWLHLLLGSPSHASK